MSFPKMTAADAKVLFGDLATAKECGCDLVNPEEEKKKAKKAALSAEEKEISAIMSKWADISPPKSYILERNLEDLLTTSMTAYHLRSWLGNQPGFSIICSVEQRNMILFPGGMSYFIQNKTTKNSILLLHNGCFHIDELNNFGCIPTNFKIYIRMLRKNYVEDLKTTKDSFARHVVCHDLDKYMFVPYLDHGVIKLHVPLLRDNNTFVSITLRKFISGLLGV